MNTIEKTAKRKKAHSDSLPTNRSTKAQKPTLLTHKSVHLTLAQIDLLRVEITKLSNTKKENPAAVKTDLQADIKNLGDRIMLAISVGNEEKT